MAQFVREVGANRGGDEEDDVVGGPGPAFATDVPALYMWDTTFRGGNFAQGAAIATLLLLVVALLIIPYLVSTNRKEAH